ncbi:NEUROCHONDRIN [Salix purpurea]|uniref:NEUROCHONDRIN n=1 Tax=Salix purpurea TaxID=77065 RepID=A0A9Q0ZF75_SALPP|nr:NEUROCHONDRIN [Salix purpurea]
MEQQQQQTPSLDDCLKLLKGERDEQRLAGLLLVTKFCNGADLGSLRKVYNAVGAHFLDRLLRTGMGKGSVSGGDNRDMYLQLSVTVLAAFCRVPDIAASKEMVLKIPLILEIMPEVSGSPVLEECYEFLYLVITSYEDGATVFYESGGMKVLASQMSSLPDGSHMMELAMKIIQSILSRLSQDVVTDTYVSELSMMVATVARQFALLHNSLKFEALHLLSEIFSSKYSKPLCDALCAMVGNNWPDHMRAGIAAILQNRVEPAEKLHALILAEFVMSIMGEGWLLGQPNLPDLPNSIPADRCFLLVLESARVEVAVFKRNVAIAFSLVERIIKLTSTMDEVEGSIIGERTLIKVINGLNETINVVLEYLQDAKEHGQKKGNDLLASVRVVGSYLAETPNACKEKVRELLDYMLTIEGEDEPSPFHSISFLLPMMCQITMDIEGCEALISSGGYKAVAECLIKFIGPSGNVDGDDSCTYLACDTILNLLLKKEQMRFRMDESTFIDLLKALGYWAGNANDLSVIIMASSICALIFDYTSEETLLNHPNFDNSSLHNLYKIIARSLASCKQDMSDMVREETDLLEIVTSGFFTVGASVPSFKRGG